MNHCCDQSVCKFNIIICACACDMKKKGAFILKIIDSGRHNEMCRYDKKGIISNCIVLSKYIKNRK